MPKLNPPSPLTAAEVSFIITAGTGRQSADVFLRKNAEDSTVFPGYWGFIAGSVALSDEFLSTAAKPRDLRHNANATAALSAVLRRQLGWSLLAELNNNNVQQFRLLGNYASPSYLPGPPQQLVVLIELKQRRECSANAGQWQAAEHILQCYQQGQCLLAAVTLALLAAVANEQDMATALATLSTPPNQPDGSRKPIACLQPLAGLRVLPVRSNTLPPAAHTNCFVLGDAAGDRIAVDPSPCDDNEFERLVATLLPLGIREILITHHHGDHNERADALARRLNVPLRMSGYTERRLRAAKPAFFNDLIVLNCEHGDPLCQWLGQPVAAIAVPGHDQGQLALAPVGQSPAWFIVGDLIQGVGTVVICPPEGNMRQYFRTLEQVIAQNPAVIVPSHGVAMAGTYRLRATLQHRQQRENQIVEHLHNGLSEDDMLGAMYPGLNPALLPLARINIQAHVGKLAEEGRVVRPT